MRAVNRLAASRRELSVARQIPYVVHVAEGIIKTQAGDFVQVFRLGGASFESADDETLNNWHERLNVTWRNIASPNVALWTHVLRRRERAAAKSVNATGFAAELAQKYCERLATETLMVNDLYLALIYRPVSGPTTTAASRLLSRAAKDSEHAVLRDAIEVCEKLGQAVVASLARYEPERLGIYERGLRCYSSLLEFFGILINGEWQAMPVPRAPLNEVLATTRPLFGSEVIEYRLPTETRLGAVLGIKEYPTPTSVGMYNALLSAPFEFVLTQSFSFLTKGTAQGLLQRQYNRMANAGDFAVSQAEELKDALDALTANEFVMGDHHLTLQVLTPPSDARSAAQGTLLKRLNDDVALARTMLADCGMTVAREDLALEAAFWAQLPGCFSLRPRKATITSRNFAAMVPWHNFPTGRAIGNHWGDALALLITSARSPYYFSLHASDPHDPDGGSRKDTGHTFICGPTGSGKTVLIGFLISMLSGQGATQVIFDKDQGLEILVRALGGVYLPLQPRAPTGFNPLQLEPTPTNVEFLAAWLRMLARGSAALTPREQTDLDQALRGTLALDRSARRLSRLLEFTDPTRPEGIHARLARWCHSAGGDHAWVFDNAADSVVPMMTGHATVGFDVTHFLTNELIRGPVNRYLFHLVEQLLDGRRLVCWVDEFSNALADPDFEHFADNAPKTWRKLNGVLCAATQTASGVLSSSIARTIVEQTATKVFFPNPEADAQDYIDGFGLTEREFRLLKEQLEPGSRMFLVKQGHDSVVCALDLKGFDAELAVISGRRSSVEELHRLMRTVGPAPNQWLPHFMKGFERR
ncbi:VirB4 family type IV secretion/conjugal transfer ATPase [Steroidobacter agaridevorans]|uniref:VirB4 family type IV secretion/conjugal transfer ATPase n=1 Tax=Steroidobacter agaridevorans TaxID=2695856 RepID=UPI00132199F3|nr:VirB4 family type IV secretion/conjugal transfer ATPase [Steroidobacter agaridevorans]GFE87290.1 transporter [Steroidobacter agaridevorans]